MSGAQPLVLLVCIHGVDGDVAIVFTRIMLNVVHLFYRGIIFEQKYMSTFCLYCLGTGLKLIS
jgi:hypothetical protein